MGPGMFGGPPPRFKRPEDEVKVAPPKSVSDVPRYLRELLGGFFSRLAYIFKMVWHTGHWILIAMVLISLFNGVMPVVGSLISKEILNELQLIISANDPVVFWGSMVMFLLIFWFVYRILMQVIAQLSHAVIRVAGEKVVRYVKLRIMEKAREVDLAAFDRPEFYENLENANREAGNRPIQVISATFDVVSKLISLASYAIILVTAPDMWWIAPVMIVMSIPTAVVNFIYRHKNYKYMRRRSKERRQMNYYSGLLVNKDMVKEIRMFDLSDTMIDRYDGVFSKYYAGIRKLILKESIWHICITFFTASISCLFFALIAMKVFEGRIMIGDYSLYTGALTSISGTVSSLITVSATVYEGTLFIDNLISFINTKPTIKPIVSQPESVSRGCAHTIEFVNVSFAYPGTDKLVLKNINLKFRPGETVVLVGLNGAGKTTFIKLLTRLYDPTEGKILLDGRDIREYDVKELYDIFGIIFQDFGKYAFTVKENIAFGDIHREINDGDVVMAAQQANASDFIERLPNGYDTPMMRFFEPDGIEPSIGQWQKLAIARAFYSTSDILILDEPTASLDPMAEQEIFNQFDKLRQDKTTIFVSHRLSSATVATKIVVLEYGELVEEGTHKELMEKQGRYYELFTTQAKRYIETEEN